MSLEKAKKYLTEQGYADHVIEQQRLRIVNIKIIFMRKLK